jgi:hypothetical protein
MLETETPGTPPPQPDEGNGGEEGTEEPSEGGGGGEGTQQ